ncbi:O-antigen ligase family protein [Pseudohongiella nitratireducens]|uniref:O-antigen ligase family protein n=1 Tax=Pseudohongiella nitratireducens TaxID=1768907 RepID=UPI0030ED817C|tara:strand:- start:502 stop:1698 length:1197 start_codon:yes stop_codon:yes gene_type:complete
MIPVIFVVFLLCVIGSRLTTMGVGPISLGAVVTLMLPAIFSVLIAIRARLVAKTFNMVLPILLLTILSIFWDVYHFLNGTFRLHNITAILLGFVLATFYAAQSVPIDRLRGDFYRLRFLEVLNITSIFYVLMMLYFSTTRTSEPAFVQLSILFFSLFLVEYFIVGKSASLYLALIVFGCTVLLGARIVLLAQILIALILIFVFVKGRFIQKAMLLIFITSSIAWVLTSGRFQDRMFGGDLGFNIGGYTINSSGRAAQWEVIVDSIVSDKYLGSGYSIPEEMFGLARWDHPHNEYLRLLHQFGLFGLFLWIWAVIGWIRMIWVLFSTKNDSYSGREFGTPTIKLSAITGLYVIGVSVVMITDNTLAYSYILYPLGLLIGVTSASLTNCSGQLNPDKKLG